MNPQNRKTLICSLSDVGYMMLKDFKRKWLPNRQPLAFFPTPTKITEPPSLPFPDHATPLKTLQKEATASMLV